MIRVTGINLLTYINWICDDSSHTRFSDLKKRKRGQGSGWREGGGKEEGREKGKEIKAHKVQQTYNLPSEYNFIFQRPLLHPPHLHAAPDLWRILTNWLLLWSQKVPSMKGRFAGPKVWWEIAGWNKELQFYEVNPLRLNPCEEAGAGSCPFQWLNRKKRIYPDVLPKHRETSLAKQGRKKSFLHADEVTSAVPQCGFILSLLLSMLDRL